MIEEISCCGYRGFAKKQSLKLARPNGERGSGLTVLIGPNGGGKSTLVECFSKIASNNVSFTEGKRNKFAGDKVSIEIKHEGLIDKLESVASGGSETIWNGQKNLKYIISHLEEFLTHTLAKIYGTETPIFKILKMFSSEVAN